VLRDGDNNPFALKHNFGKGLVYYFESAVTLAYMRRSSPVVQQWIVEPALRQVSQMPIQLKQGSDKVIFRGLVGASGLTAILSNWGEEQTVVVSFRGLHKVKNAQTGEPIQVDIVEGNTLATMTLAAKTSAVMMAE
jgi:hypothetical protein